MKLLREEKEAEWARERAEQAAREKAEAEEKAQAKSDEEVQQSRNGRHPIATVGKTQVQRAARKPISPQRAHMNVGFVFAVFRTTYVGCFVVSRGAPLACGCRVRLGVVVVVV
eukprot:1128660-Prymnesium_polylepis.1